MPMPRVEIKFCTKCKWNFRATWYMQELLSTFGMDLGEIALIPTDGGIFQVKLYTGGNPTDGLLLWDRKINGGFPDSKELKKLVRDVIMPHRDLGHVDRHNGGLITEVAKPVDSESLEHVNKEQGSESAAGNVVNKAVEDTNFECSGPDCNLP